MTFENTIDPWTTLTIELTVNVKHFQHTVPGPETSIAFAKNVGRYTCEALTKCERCTNAAVIPPKMFSTSNYWARIRNPVVDETTSSMEKEVFKDDSHDEDLGGILSIRIDGVRRKANAGNNHSEQNHTPKKCYQVDAFVGCIPEPNQSWNQRHVGKGYEIRVH